MELLARCRDLALPFYGNLLRSTQQTLRDRLFEQAEKGGSNADQRVYFEAIQTLNDSAVAMQAAFDAQLEHSYRQFLIGRDDDEIAPPLYSSSLSLVGREQLEDELAVSMIVSRANTQCAESLWKLNRRLAVLRGGKKVADDSNPFGPAKVGLALRQAMSELAVDQKARIFIYKHVGKLLLAVFGKIFNSLNDTLSGGGVLPNLKFSLAKEADGHDAYGDTETDAAVAQQNQAASAAQEADQRRMVSSIIDQFRMHTASSGPRRQTFSGISYGGLRSGRDGAKENFQPNDYALVLSTLQQMSEFNVGQALEQPMPIAQVEELLFAELGERADPQARHQLAEQDADTVDLVGMVFRYMLDDPKIPDIVKSLLSHLHTPYLKLAILDKTFLENQQHNARVLINRMAETGARWVVDEKERVVLPKLKGVVEIILREFVDDIGLFDHLLEDFNRFRDGLEKRAEMVEKRNRSAQEGIERLSTAKQRAATEIEERIKGFTIPESILQLLRKPWTDFLAFNYLRNGENSLSWKAALKVVDGVLWSVRDDGGRSREEFQRYQQQLEQSIAEGLRTIGYDSEAGEELLSALREGQEQAYQGHAIVKPVQQAVTVAKKSVLPTPPVFTAEEQIYADMLREKISFGALFEFDRPGQLSLQCKLAWFSRVSAHYMFVNQSGIKQLVETLPNLVRGLCAGTVRIVEPERRSFMERALTAILSKLHIATY
ncbi:MAG: hypothetical protein JWM78_1146 [Verrucomicrobiaceae bacterium]|nr:hypothetical protein [Verrucomicrobiaceae bacterium]